MSPIDTIGKIGTVVISLLMFYLVFVVCYAIYLYFSPNTTRPTVGWYWFQFINNIIGVGPQPFTVATSNIAVGNDVLWTNTNGNLSNCMSNCNITSGCIGFQYTYGTTGNTCVSFSGIKALVPPPAGTTANTYFVAGNEPSQTYVQFVNQNATTPSSIPSYTGSSVLDCGSNCAANSTCNGFALTTLTNLCAQSNTVTTATLASVAGTSTYILFPTSNIVSVGTPYATAGILP